jgi:hypothetical protein
MVRTKAALPSISAASRAVGHRASGFPFSASQLCWPAAAACAGRMTRSIKDTNGIRNKTYQQSEAAILEKGNTAGRMLKETWTAGLGALGHLETIRLPLLRFVERREIGKC